MPAIGEERISEREQNGFGERERDATDQATRQDTLKVSGTVTEDDKGHAALLPQSVDPSKDANALSAVLDRLPDLDLGRVLLGLLEHDRLGLLEALELCRPARLALGLVALAGLLLLDELVLVRLEDLGGLLLGGRRRSEPLSLGLTLGGRLADEDVDGVAQSRDEGTADRLERLGLRAVARLVVAGSFIDVQRICTNSVPTSVRPHGRCDGRAHAAVRDSRKGKTDRMSLRARRQQSPARAPRRPGLSPC